MFDITGTSATLAPVKGSVDNIAPVEGLFKVLMHMYEASEIYKGDIGENKFVPKEGDLVIDHDSGVLKKVTKVSTTTYLSDLTDIIVGNTYNKIQRTYGYESPDMFRLYIDKSVTPHSAVINKRLTVAGAQTSYVIVYRGENALTSSNSISRVYDTGGVFQTNRVPLELVDNEMHQAKAAIWSALPFKITEDITDGEILTAVFYNDAGHVVHKCNLLVESTGFTGQVYGSLKFIESIDLISPFINKDNPNKLSKLLNAPLTDQNMRLVVNYSDGSKSEEYPLSSPRFELLGLDQLDNTTIAVEVTVQAKYNLASNEGAVNTMGDGRFITRDYIFDINT